MKKKSIVIAALGLVVLVAGVVYYQKKIAPTRIAFVNFQDFQVNQIIEVNENTYIKIDHIKVKDGQLPDIRGYAAMYLFAHGRLNLSEQNIETIRKAGQSGMKVYLYAPIPVEELSNLTPEDKKYIETCLKNGGNKNLRSMLNYTRRVLDGKTMFTEEVEEPYVYPKDYFYAPGEDEVFTSLESYEAYYKGTERYTEGGPKVLLISQILGMSSGKGFLKPLIASLEKRGLNVYPVSSFRKRLQFAKAVDPDLVVYIPHGRFAGTKGVAWLEGQNIPMLSPVVVFAPYDDWLQDQRGMDGGMLSQNVVMPELDGGAVPYAIAAQFENERGLMLFEGLPKRIDRFTSLAERVIKLKTTPNKDKKLVVFYYKGAGKNALVAEGLEIVPSLWNLLNKLKAAGYDTGPLPATSDELFERIQAEGPVLGDYALGTFEDWIKGGKPALVKTDEYVQWLQEYCQPEMLEDLERDQGPAPGEHMTTVKDGVSYMAIARVQFGNVVLLPVPGGGSVDETNEDISQMPHGGSTAPPYAYLASYLWAREGFNADAVMHFGTHGSVEFTPWKQVALSEYDWPDALLGGIPHYYVYNISNIGEALVAKRRSYAVMNTHITPPMMQSEVYGDIEALDDAFERYWTSQQPLLKAEHKKTIRSLIAKADLEKDLEMDIPADPAAVSDAQLRKIHHYLHDIEQAKVTKGLHVLGQAYTEAEAYETLQQMSIDYLAHNLSKMDLIKGRATQEQVDDAHYFEDHYRYPAFEMIEKIFKKSAEPDAFITAEDKAILEADRKNADPLKTPTREELDYLKALKGYAETLQSIRAYHKAIVDSPTVEMDTIVNALGGGYVLPQSGGDPVVNPNSIPSGRNTYGISAESTPTPEAWEVGKMLVDQMIAAHRERTGDYPNKVAFTLWSSEFVRQEGTTIAEVLYLLGVEPVRNARGRVHDVQLIPIEQLKRPRIDVVVQTSGQFRDLAASRIYLINKAVALASTADDGPDYPNRVREGTVAAETVMKQKGASPADAKELSTLRVFGGLNGSYSTGIMGMVEAGDRWEEDSEIAERYLYNMGAVYDKEHWGRYQPGMFEAALQNTDTVLQPRSANTWGPLSLDHVYEFMGGMNLAVRHVTGENPTSYFSDMRNPTKPVIQNAKQAIWAEARTTMLNPKYIAALQEEGASAADTFAETIRNTYGWEVMQPELIDEAVWDKYNEVYIEDKHDLKIQEFFREKNPYALQEMTAVMLETARKGYWNPDPEVLRNIAELHAQLVEEFEAGCSGFVCDNAKLREMISQALNAESKQAYLANIEAVRVASEQAEAAEGVTLSKEDVTQTSPALNVDKPASRWAPIIAAIVVFGVIVGVMIRKRQQVV